MENLNIYHTRHNFTRLLVSFLKHEKPQNVLDLGAGDGALLKAAYERWGKATYHAVDIDIRSSINIKQKLPFARFYRVDGLTENISQNTKLKVGSIDVAVCNPPFKMLDRDKNLNDTLRCAKLVNTAKLSLLTSDIVFLAQNLLMLKSGGELGIILPDGLFTGERCRALREDLLNNHRIMGVIELPDGIFCKTEAKTHILLLEKDATTDDIIPLYKSNNVGNIEDTVFIKSNDLLYRMDYSYNKWNTNISHIHKHTLSSLGAEIKRGLRSKKELETLGVSYFHTTSFQNDIQELDFTDINTDIHDTIAGPGDILIARVGKRCYGKVAIVKNGNRVISDCIFRLRVGETFRAKVLSALKSNYGQEWIKAHGRGVCSKFISKSDLLKFTIDATHKLQITG